MTENQRQTLRQVMEAIMEGVDAGGPMGAPGGHIYAALMGIGFTLESYEQLMGALVTAGKIKKVGHCYFRA